MITHWLPKDSRNLSPKERGDSGGETDWLAGPSPGEVAVGDIKGTVGVDFIASIKTRLRGSLTEDMPKFEML